MELTELKTRLEIPLDDESQDERLKLELKDGIEYAQEYCNNPFLNKEGLLELPSPVKKGIAMMIKIDRSNEVGVSSESIGGMSKTYTSDYTRYEAVYKLWRKYRKVKFRPLR
ncbi:phage head-tail connector protein [Bacillus safensis]|uniref:phage head-tail connector protein n=1 Tax=Bacillus TaxID=1386 RepID=UPI000E72E57C|nr:phage head-tail connector protein [Bacillus safensis]MCY1093983.1 phage head-tail connector protein [Bacillus safensis]RKE76733.1 gp6-like head-tail connector protein [Bacillus safensis]